MKKFLNSITRDATARLAAVGTVCLLVSVIGGKGVESLDRHFYDALSSRSAENRRLGNSPVAVIEIDEPSIKALGRFPWSRGLHGRLLDALHSAGAKAVLFDAIFSEHADEVGDRDFAESLKRHPIAVLASAGPLVPSPATQGEPSLSYGLMTLGEMLDPLPSFSRAAAGIGHIAVKPDTDGVLRRYPLLALRDGGVFPSIAKAGLMIAGDTKSLAGIPLDSDGMMRINFAAISPASIPRLSYADALTAPRERLAASVGGKIVVVLANFAGGGDWGPTPLSTKTPYGYVHVMALTTVLSNSHLRWVEPWAALFLALLTVLLLEFLPGFNTAGRLAILTVMLSCAVVAVVAAAFEAERLFLAPGLALISVLLYGVGKSGFEWARSSRRGVFLENALSRFVGGRLARFVIGSGGVIRASRREMTVLFCDITDFTRFAEEASPDDIQFALGAFYAHTTKAIEANGGNVDKLIGDAVMAYWGFPQEDSDSPVKAVRAALEIQSRIPELTRELGRLNVRPFQLRVGIATGHMTAGLFGTQSFAQVTVFGRSVNLASRLLGVVEREGIVLDRLTHVKAQEKVGYQVQELESVRLKGIDNPVPCFLVGSKVESSIKSDL